MTGRSFTQKVLSLGTNVVPSGNTSGQAPDVDAARQVMLVSGSAQRGGRDELEVVLLVVRDPSDRRG